MTKVHTLTHTHTRDTGAFTGAASAIHPGRAAAAAAAARAGGRIRTGWSSDRLGGRCSVCQSVPSAVSAHSSSAVRYREAWRRGETRRRRRPPGRPQEVTQEALHVCAKALGRVCCCSAPVKRMDVLAPAEGLRPSTAQITWFLHGIRILLFARVGVYRRFVNGTASATRAPCGQSP